MHLLVAIHRLEVKCMVYGFGKNWAKIPASSFISCIILGKLLKQSKF